ncbi:Hypothetical predicted protein [Octopus vulgaris]|uniref:Uncharacterized protein n=1 Tax=Octopus vulgaris TaxID=6645 RepID=A0AA36FB83_OCTVU|nr:Hypothetical predicted protein [Octopus vulgaris]
MGFFEESMKIKCQIRISKTAPGQQRAYDQIIQDSKIWFEEHSAFVFCRSSNSSMIVLAVVAIREHCGSCAGVHVDDRSGNAGDNGVSNVKGAVDFDIEFFGSSENTFPPICPERD